MGGGHKKVVGWLGVEDEREYFGDPNVSVSVHYVFCEMLLFRHICNTLEFERNKGRNKVKKEHKGSRGK